MHYIDEVSMEKLNKVNTSSWNTAKDNVFLRLINEKYLSKYGENVAYTKFLDLAVVFSLQEKKDNTIVSHLLTKEELSKFNVDIDEVKKTALCNSSNDRKRRVMTFKQHILKDNILYPILRMPKQSMMGVSSRSMPDIGIVEDIDEENNRDNVLMICNKHDTFGASYMVIPEVLEEVYERFSEENFYVIPLSVHQVMCIRHGYASHEGEKPQHEVEDDLLDMIEEFNDSNNKSWKDILSYKIYYYYGDDGKKLFPIN